jgi:hypothetical protein
MKIFRMVCVVFIAISMTACAVQKWPVCNDKYSEGAKLRQIADDHEVCLETVGNSLIVANALATGFELWEAEEALKVSRDLVALLGTNVSEIMFRGFVVDELTRFPGLLEISMIYITGFDSGRFMDKESKAIVVGYLEGKVIPILEAHVKRMNAVD